MVRHIALAAALLAFPAIAQEEPQGAPSPGEIVAQAAPSEWIAITPEDLLVMTLAPAPDGKERKVIIQLIPPPFSQPWVANIRTLAKAHWWDGLAIVRSQDNYVVQWGDPEGDDEANARPLPEGLRSTSEKAYVSGSEDPGGPARSNSAGRASPILPDAYADQASFAAGFPIGMKMAAVANVPKAPLTSVTTLRSEPAASWPVHCYGTVGVGRGMSPDAGTGAELYTVIGHAPRHLDRNIAVVGRVVEGIEHLSTLPRGTGPLGFYEDPAQRVRIPSIRLASELPRSEQPKFEYLSTEGETFAHYADARANRREPFFIVPAGGADVCNIPVPVRRAPG